MFQIPLMAGQAAAPAPTTPSAGGPASLLNSGLIPIALMFAVFYFLLIRPQQQKQKALAQKVAGMEKGDEVITTGGMIGKIWAVKDDRVVVQVNDVRLDFMKSAIVDVVKPGN